MRLSWNEIRARAAAFAREWAGEGYEKGQTQLFYRDFFEVFGIPVRRVAAFEDPVKTLGERRGYIDLFWKGVLLVEQKSMGRDLKKAKTQALDYFPGLRDSELPRYLLLSDFQSFELHDLDTGEEAAFALAARAAHPGASLADLYDPDLMPAGLRRAHAALDRAVDRLYARRALASDRERAELLLARYEAMIAPLTAAPTPRRRRVARKS